MKKTQKRMCNHAMMIKIEYCNNIFLAIQVDRIFEDADFQKTFSKFIVL